MNFKDKREREWEVFLDPCYYEMTCVRCISVEDYKDFNSHMSFHFPTMDQAEDFVKLLKVAT